MELAELYKQLRPRSSAMHGLPQSLLLQNLGRSTLYVSGTLTTGSQNQTDPRRYIDTPENPLAWWGLDYPPLSAYQSWLCAQLLHRLEPEALALGTSRGWETPSSRCAMRLTVILADVLSTVLYSRVRMQHCRCSSQYSDIPRVHSASPRAAPGTRCATLDLLEQFVR